MKTHIRPRRLLYGGAILTLVAAAAVVAVVANRPAAADEPVVKVKTQSGDAPAPAAKDGEPGDHTMFGGTPDRNMVNFRDKFPASKIPSIEDGKFKDEGDVVIKWRADLGSRAYGGPIVAGGKVFVGTNNEYPRNKRDVKKNADGDEEPVDMGILMAFNAGTGSFLWQGVFDKLPSGQVNDWPKEGICATPLTEGDRVYFVTNRCTLVCADVNGRAGGKQGIEKKYKGPTDAAIIWELDMIKDLGVFPHNMTASSPMVVGDIIFLTTANGVDEGHINIPAPQAPSFIAVNKNTGKVVWKRNDPGKKIMHGQWSNPVYAEIGGVRQVIFPGGDGWLHAFKPETGEPIWQFDANPKNAVYELGGSGTKSDFIGTPVVHDGKVYIGVGQDPEHFTGIGHFWCINPAGKTGDISPELVDKVEKGEDGKDKVTGKPNPASGMVWHYGGSDDRKFVPREFHFGRTMSTATIVDGILYISELAGYVHCLDAKTGKKFWQYDLKSSVWGSTYYVDGKIFIAAENGDVFVFKHDKNPQVIDELDNPDAKDRKDFDVKRKAKRAQIEKLYLLSKAEFDAPVRSTPVVANGVLYVMTEKNLYAIAPKGK
ncbi:PQQ-binding-like beta-propeller repeat protein [Fimbriiglobus ruber]|uniref:Pyrrolo-quinoline quinone repeat domain-containing protein n=1 Tax=Fimbriiglobus ruber TaxID=1908690 RepID=A0A225DSA7_9BACT|nr:PQQ-binding-like beta-propeller repeat protein [Fimbriiglobus ruber]OWK40486.1 hypothetical protein FRUB_05405 [Fimbriiglobus ruber]